MAKIYDVCVQGDGAVGRTLALLLAQARLKVALVAQAAAEPPPSQDVRAYALNRASRDLLSSLRAWPERALATPVTQMRVWGDDGGRIAFDSPPSPDDSSQASDALAWIVDVPALEQGLAQACRYQSQIEIVDSPAPAALKVICEGRGSRSRQELGAQWASQPYPQTAIASRLESTQAHHGQARQWFCGGEVLALLPLSEPSGNSLALVWSVSHERASALCLLPEPEFCAAVAAVCMTDNKLDAVGESFRLIGPRATWPLALGAARHWVGPGWALAGDAAHTVHPLAGQGLNLGLADVACLAKVLTEREYWRALGDEKLLRRYERARKAEVAAVSTVTDTLHNLFTHSGSGALALRNWGMNAVASAAPLKNWLMQRAAGQ
jgi:2-polyprenyl-6-methoxyphenol hydroxylase-like FAD-dependent oxidoreductase